MQTASDAGTFMKQWPTVWTLQPLERQQQTTSFTGTVVQAERANGLIWKQATTNMFL